jgi:hypothetical protein
MPGWPSRTSDADAGQSKRTALVASATSVVSILAGPTLFTTAPASDAGRRRSAIDERCVQGALGLEQLRNEKPAFVFAEAPKRGPGRTGHVGFQSQMDGSKWQTLALAIAARRPAAGDHPGRRQSL